jgi:preprotein translocase subunit SecG
MDLSLGRIIVNVFHIILCLALIFVVLFQSGKSAGLSGAIAGGAENFLGKNKGKHYDAILKKYTSVAAIAFLLLSVALYVIITK